MGILRDSPGAGRDDRTAPMTPAPGPPLPAPGGALTPVAAEPPVAPGQAAEPRSDLRRRRDSLAEQVTELHWDLGGLAYEMAIRDHFRLDVLVRRAAILQERDAELAEVERLLRMQEDGVAGSCPSCAAPHSRGALYCWQCGTTLMERLPSSTAGAGAEEQTATTEAMDALLAPDASSADAASAFGADGGRQHR
ncbi:MAG TPA: hypothetical protein VN772_03785 [Solirubrobacteraceae bacterium]|nr:hypothetical protein [Solirubrobacteraceae bacterium]